MTLHKPEKCGEEKILYSGKIVEVVGQPMKIGSKDVVFESARRAPGVRLIIVKDGKILLTREYRSELEGWDYRLPGGKVFDSLEEYKGALDSGEELLGFAREAAKVEALEECGIEISGDKGEEMECFCVTHAGATIVWDLYYFVISDFKEVEQQVGEGEVIEKRWVGFSEAEKMCLDGLIREDRSVGVLLKYLLRKK